MEHTTEITSSNLWDVLPRSEPYQEYIDDKAAAMLRAATEGQIEIRPSSDRIAGLEQCAAMDQKLRLCIDKLRIDAQDDLITITNYDALKRYRRLLDELDNSEEGVSQLVPKHLWPETVVERLVNGKQINLEVYPVEPSHTDELGPHFAATDFSIAALLQEMSPRTVQIFPNTIGYLGDGKRLVREDTVYAPDMKNFSVNNTHLGITIPLDKNPDILVDTIASLACQSGIGHIKEDAHGGIRFYPSESAARLFRASDPVELRRAVDGGIVLKLPNGELSNTTRRAANFINHVDNALWISIGDTEQNNKNLPADLLLSQIIQRDHRQQFTYISDTPRALVTLAAAKMLQNEIQRYADSLRKDVEFRQMPPDHPYIYIDQNYGCEVEDYPERIFPNDLRAIEWLVERHGLIIPADYEEGLVYTDIGRGPFSIFDVFAAKFASDMRLMEPAEPNLEVIHKWKKGALPKRYNVGPKFEDALVRRNPLFAGSEQTAREKASIIAGGIEGLPVGESDLIFEGFVTCSRARDRGTYWEDNRRMARALRPGTRSKIISYNMKNSTGWFGFPSIPIDENILLEARYDAGLEVLDMITINDATLPRGHSEMILSISALRHQPWKK